MDVTEWPGAMVMVFKGTMYIVIEYIEMTLEAYFANPAILAKQSI